MIEPVIFLGRHFYVKKNTNVCMWRYSNNSSSYDTIIIVAVGDISSFVTKTCLVCVPVARIHNTPSNINQSRGRFYFWFFGRCVGEEWRARRFFSIDIDSFTLLMTLYT